MKITLPTLLGVLFIGLKLGHVIAWSWWLVLLPLYAVPAVAVAMIVGVLVLAVVGGLATVLLGRPRTNGHRDADARVRAAVGR